MILRRQFIALAGSVLLAGCRSPAPPAAGPLPPGAKAPAPAKPPLNVVAIDRSGSTAPMRNRQIDLLKQMVLEGRQRGERLTIWAVDNKAVSVLQPEPMSDDYVIRQAALVELKTPSKERATRTRPALFWEKMADEFSGPNAPNGIVRILYCTDGDNDWADEANDLKKAADRLAQNPRVFVSMAGLKPDATEPLKKQFAAFGDRAKFANPANEETVVQELRALGQP